MDNSLSLMIADQHSLAEAMNQSGEKFKADLLALLIWLMDS